MLVSLCLSFPLSEMLQIQVDVFELVGGLLLLTRELGRSFRQDAATVVANEGHLINCSGADGQGHPSGRSVSAGIGGTLGNGGQILPCWFRVSYPWWAGGVRRAPGALLLSRASFLL